MTLGEKIASERRKLNYTQEQLAQLLGVSRQSVSKWESDLAYPETEKLIQLGKLFDCSMDYLLKENVTNRSGSTADSSPWQKLGSILHAQFHERKSERMIGSLPLYHIARNARGFFAIGLNARGVFALGLRAQGIFTLGLLSIGLLSLGMLSMGFIAIGTLSFGLLSIGSIAMGLFAVGAVAIGILSIGALSVGCFSLGASASGYYGAIGDAARGMVVIGERIANGSIYAEQCPLQKANITPFQTALDSVTPSWLCHIKDFYLHLWRMIQ
ncbi:MAG: helix-turn-helix transcriptional regulator [Clostridia bacterium]|nr:helix-turn-helix transcriptional regulator [Clostridia bacterium]